MIRRTPTVLIVLMLAAATVAAAPWALLRAQEEPGARSEPIGPEEIHRTRGVSAWRRYVWSLDRGLLHAFVHELETARQIGGKADFTQLFLLSFGYLALGERKMGSAALEEARALVPDFPGLLLVDAFVLILDGDKETAVELLDRYVNLVATGGSDAEFGRELVFLGYLHRGTQLHDLMKHHQAIADLEQALAVVRREHRSVPVELVARLALAHQSVDQLDDAEALVAGLLEEEPGNPHHYFNLGLLYGAQERYEEAKLWYERALEHKSDYPEAHVKLAFIAFKEERLTDMRAHLDAFALLSGPSPEAETAADIRAGYGAYWMAVGRRLYRDDHIEEAERHYRRAIAEFKRALDHRPGCVRALNQLTILGFQLGLSDDEIQPYRERYDAIHDQEQPSVGAFRRTFC